MTAARRVIRLLETIYAPAESPTAWLRAVVDEARPLLDHGEGLDAYFVELGGPGVHGWGFASAGGSLDALVARFAAWQQAMPEWFREGTHRVVPTGYASEFPQSDLRALVPTSGRTVGAADAYGVNGLGADGRGCVLAAFVPASSVPAGRSSPGPDRRVWGRLATHLAAGSRLVQGAPPAGSAPDAAEAVVSPDGRVEHATGEATARSAREALGEDARGLERSRTGRLPADEATSGWRPLVSARWTLVPHEQRDGRRLLLARPNAPRPTGVAALSPREAQSVGAAALGHTDKLIAYELGLGSGTVARPLARARAKLGVSSRADLIAAWLGTRGARLAPGALPPAEREVAALLVSGFNRAEIASLRGVTVGTVNKQVECLYARLGVSSRNELVAKLGGAGAGPGG